MDKGRRVWVERIGHGSSFCEIDFGELYTTFWHCKVDITSRIPSFPNPIPKSKLSLFFFANAFPFRIGLIISQTHAGFRSTDQSSNT